VTRASRRRLSTAGGLPPAMAPFAVLAMLFLLLPVVGLVYPLAVFLKHGKLTSDVMSTVNVGR